MKRLALLTIAILCLILLAGTSMSVYANEPLFECHTDPELIEEATNALVQKKLTELNKTQNSQENEIMLFQHLDFEGTKVTGFSMPSTGEVRALIVPLAFPGYEIPARSFELMQDEFFGIHESADKSFFFTFDDERSATELFRAHSNGKLNFTGDIMPQYETAELPSYYDENDSGLTDLLSEILSYYKRAGIVSDYSRYDSDNDGYVDCLAVVYPMHRDLKYSAGTGGSLAWGNKVVSGSSIKIENDSIKVNTRMTLGVSADEPNDVHAVGAYSILHECGHLMGLPDNYDTTEDCTLHGTGEILTAGEGAEQCYFNAYYRYLLDWIEPVVLPYKENLTEIMLCAYEAPDDIDKERAVIFIPDSSQLPFTEFYMAEYVVGLHIQRTPMTEKHAGVRLWHINGAYKQPTCFLNKTNFIKPVYKNGGTTDPYGTFMYDVPNDLYITGDEFSDTTVPSSKFYDDVYTGAYMKVLSMDDEKATILAGFKEPDLTPAPTITISLPSKKAVKSEEKRVEYTITYNADHLDSVSNIFKDITIDKIGTVNPLWGMSAMEDNIATFKVTNFRGEGTIGITVNGRAVWNVGSLGGVKYASPVTSEIFYVDDTPPEIELNGASEITLEYGAPYDELGAEITDNLDPEIESKLVIDSSKVNVNQAGTYYVYYNAIDHAGNVAEQVVRTVTVLEAPPLPEDRIEITKITSKIFIAKPIFEATEPPPAEEIRLYLSCKRDGVQQHSELLELNEKMLTAFYIPPQYADCDIDIYVWDKKMRPLMPPQRMNRTIFE